MTSGSLMETFAVTLQSTIAILTFLFVSVIMQNLVISEAVPAVVFTATYGTKGFLDWSIPS